MRRVALVRHGRTAWNQARRIQGSTDVPLDEVGRVQAAAAADELARLGSWTHVVSSPLLRASETAAIIAARLCLPLHPPLAALVERDCGVAEGLATDDATRRWPDLAYPGSEELETLGHRIAAALAPIGPGAIVVGHGQALRRGTEVLTGAAVPRIANAETIVLERTETGWRRVDAAPASHVLQRAGGRDWSESVRASLTD